MHTRLCWPQNVRRADRCYCRPTIASPRNWVQNNTPRMYSLLWSAAEQMSNQPRYQNWSGNILPSTFHIFYRYRRCHPVYQVLWCKHLARTMYHWQNIRQYSHCIVHTMLLPPSVPMWCLMPWPLLYTGFHPWPRYSVPNMLHPSWWGPSSTLLPQLYKLCCCTIRRHLNACTVRLCHRYRRSLCY